jgi:hypothetical protein
MLRTVRVVDAGIDFCDLRQIAAVQLVFKFSKGKMRSPRLRLHILPSGNK